MYLSILIGLVVFLAAGVWQYTKEHGLKWSMVIANIGMDFFLVYGYLWVVKSESGFKPWALNIGTFFGLATFGAYYLDDWLLKKREGGEAKPATIKVQKKTSGHAKRGGSRGWL